MRRLAFKRALACGLVATWMTSAGCGAGAGPGAAAPAAASAATAGDSRAAAPTGSAVAGGTPARRGELAQPDDSTMVLLYHDVAGIAPPMDRWVEADRRVRVATGPQRAAQRAQVRTELEAAMRAVRDVGALRLSLNDQLSDYDPQYGEYTLRALAPSSSIGYRALDQQVSLRFGNGRDAQIWTAGREEAATVEDSFRYGRNVVLDVLLQITGVEPAPGGGTLIADVVEYELRTRDGSRLLTRQTPARSAP